MYISDKCLKLAAKGDISGVQKMLVENPALISATGGHNRTLLWESANAGRFDLVKYLVDKGADVNIPGRYRHETFVLVKPMSVAIKKHRTEIADNLKNAGTFLDIYTAAYLGMSEDVEKLMGHSPSIINKQQPEEGIWQVTPLHHAVAGGQKKTAEILIKKGAEVTRHATLLFDMACRMNRIDLIEMLIEAGADLKRAEAFSVIHSNSPGIIGLFFSRGCPVDGTLTYVSRGDKGEHADWVQALLNYGADVHEVDHRGRTALHNAARAGFAKVITVLINAGADVNAKMATGETPLRLAVKKKRLEAAELLKRFGAKG